MVGLIWNDAEDRKSSDGKTGLEVLMMVIEQGLNPSLDESQRVFSGPLISDLLQKVSFPCKIILY
jgi:hypothetical protein